jgi:hypothetical protein
MSPPLEISKKNFNKKLGTIIDNNPPSIKKIDHLAVKKVEMYENTKTTF